MLSIDKAASEAIQSGAPFTFAPDDARLGRLISSSEDDARTSGRGQELDAFLTHIKSRPSLALSHAYFQGRVQKSQEAEEAATEARHALDILSRAKGVTIWQMLVAVERTAMAKGEALGRFEELVLLIRNYGAYSADFAAANQRDRDSRARWAAALGAAASSMAARPTMSVSCTRFGNMVNCTGNRSRSRSCDSLLTSLSSLTSRWTDALKPSQLSQLLQYVDRERGVLTLLKRTSLGYPGRIALAVT